MSNDQDYGYTPEPQDQPGNMTGEHLHFEEDKTAKRKGTNKKILKYGGMTLGGLLLFGMGAATGGGSAGDVPESEVIETEVEVIKEVEVPGEEVVKEVEVERVPDVCEKAFDEADEWLSMGSEVARMAGDLIVMIPEAAEAGMNYDVAGIESLTARIEKINGEVQALTAKGEKNKYPEFRDECLSK